MPTPVAYSYVAGTFDTKGSELQYLANCLNQAGLPTKTVDLATGRLANNDSTAYNTIVDTTVSAVEVAACHPGGAEVVMHTSDRGEAVAAMAIAFEHYLLSRDDVAGVIGAGGSGGTALLAPAFRAIPIGVPKVLVSTMASGNVEHYVGASDMTMIHSVTDVEGLNSISRRVLGNAAHALAGMVAHAHSLDTRQSRQTVGLSMFGVTTPCIKNIVAQLDAEYDCLVFHATGTGGQCMEKLVDSGMLSAVLDITTTEIADLLVGGVLAATDDRLGAVIRRGVPYVGSVGALDMVNFGERDTVPQRFAGRQFHVHNPQVTLMRTTADENRQCGEWLGAKLNQMTGPVRFLIPEDGISLIDIDGEVFYDPEADRALFDALERTVVQKQNRQLVRVPAAINDPVFVRAAVKAFRDIV